MHYIFERSVPITTTNGITINFDVSSELFFDDQINDELELYHKHEFLDAYSNLILDEFKTINQLLEIRVVNHHLKINYNTKHKNQEKEYKQKIVSILKQNYNGVIPFFIYRWGISWLINYLLKMLLKEIDSYINSITAQTVHYPLHDVK